MKPETRFKIKIKPALEKLPNSWTVKIQQVCILGTPDFLLCINGWFVALELKKDRTAPATALQKLNIHKINKAGGFGYFVYPENWVQILRTLKSLAQGDTHGRDQAKIRKPKPSKPPLPVCTA
jgi:hypothetical protein